MAKVAIVTDSTANLPETMLDGLPIYSLPLQVIWDGKIYEDGIDIKADDFYNRLQTSVSMPSTSQATPHAFKTLYRKLLDEGYDILSVHISSKLSGTMASAITAKNEFPGSNIELFDSKSASMGLGFQALAAANAAKQGACLEECKDMLDGLRPGANALFVVNTLDFLHRGGRIGGAAAFFGNAFNLKPILGLNDGVIEAIDKVRTKSKALNKMLDIFEERIQNSARVHVSCLHANAPVEAQILLDRVLERFGSDRIVNPHLTELSPVIGTHTGPGTVGLAYMAE